MKAATQKPNTPREGLAALPPSASSALEAAGSEAESALPPQTRDQGLRRVATRAAGWLAVCCAGALAGFGYRFWTLNEWFDEGARSLAPLAVTLIEKGQPVRPEWRERLPEEEASYASLDELVLAAVASGREVVHLSRSDPRRDPIWRGWWARVFLRTKLAGGEGPGRPLALAILYERRNGGFALVRLHTLGI